MKKIALTLLTILSFACICSFIACSNNNNFVEVKFKDSIEWAEAIYGEECDLTEYVDQKEDKEYYVTAVQVDVKDNMKEIKLVCDGLKFTPTILDDVFVTLHEKNGEKDYRSLEYKLKVVQPRDRVVNKIYTSHHDTNFTVKINTDSRYLHGDKSTSAKISWLGAEASFTDRWQYFTTLMGDDITESYSVTNWEDAVLSFWVYNPTDKELEFSPIWSHTSANLTLVNDPRTIQTAKPNAWTEIKYSLRYYGMTENFFYNHALYTSYTTEKVEYGMGTAPNGKLAINQNWWTVRWGGRKKAGEVYSYDFYVSNFDIRNYDQTLDKDLDNTLNKFDKEFIYGGEGLIAINDVAQSKDKIEIEVKVDANKTTRSSKANFCVITEDWQQYVGYFDFNVKRSAENGVGVKVKKKEGTTDTYIVSAELIYGSFGEGTDRNTRLTHLYFGGSEADVYVGKVNIIKGEEKDYDVIIAGVDKSFSTNKSDVTTVSFEYKVEGNGYVSLCLYDSTQEKYYGYYALYKYEEKEERKGLTFTSLDDGWVRCEMNVAELDKFGESGKPNTFNQIFVRGDFTTTNGYMKNFSFD